MNAKQYINLHLEQLKKKGVIEDFTLEKRFDKIRRFRFDYAIEEKKIAIEYEGVFSTKSRHTGKMGYSKDCEKYNLAILNGWKVLRYTAVNFGNLEKDLNKLLEQ